MLPRIHPHVHPLGWERDDCRIDRRSDTFVVVRERADAGALRGGVFEYHPRDPDLRHEDDREREEEKEGKHERELDQRLAPILPHAVRISGP